MRPESRWLGLERGKGRAVTLALWATACANMLQQDDLAGSSPQYLGSVAQIYAGLPGNWRSELEHKMDEPVFCSTLSLTRLTRFRPWA